MRQIILDLETTGLDPMQDEILQIGVVSWTGSVLMNTYLKPVGLSAWPKAQAIHGISPERVAECPTLGDVLPHLAQLTAGAWVVIYNAGYDLRFLPPEIRSGLGRASCAMLAFARTYGQLQGEPGPYWRWHKLTDAARIAGHRWDGTQAHDAVGDCLATLSVCRWIGVQRRQQRERAA